MCFTKPFAAVVLLVLFLSANTLSLSAGTVGSNFSQRITDSPSFFIENAGSAVSVSGRVKTPEGRPIKGAMVMIKDAQTNAVIARVLSSGFGYYRLDNIETGRTYVLSVSHKVYLFALPAHLLEINEERSGVDFVGEILD